MLESCKAKFCSDVDINRNVDSLLLVHNLLKIIGGLYVFLPPNWPSTLLIIDAFEMVHGSRECTALVSCLPRKATCSVVSTVFVF